MKDQAIERGNDVKPMADALRALAMDAVEAAKSGHPGMPMGMAEIAVALWTRHLKHDPAAPRWADRDRFVLSNGHGSMLHDSYMSRPNIIVVPGGKMSLAMQLILTPMILQLMDRKRRAG